MRRILFLVPLLAIAALSCGGKASLPKGKLDGLAKTAVEIVPEDTAILFGLNWSRLKESKLYDTILELINKEKESRRRIDDLNSICGLYMPRELDSIVVANRASMDEKTALVLVKGNWDEERAAVCLNDYWKQKYFNDLVPRKEGKLSVYAVGGTANLYAYWPAPDTALLAPKNLKDRELIAGIIDARSSVKSNKAFTDFLSRTDTTATFWVVMTASSSEAFQSAFAQLTPDAEAKPLGLYLSVDVTNGLNAVVGLRFADAKDAKEIARKAKQELAAARKDEDWGPYLSDISVTVVDKDILLRATLTEEKLIELVTAFEGYLPSLGKFVKENIGG